ncbi:protein PIH1D3-like [Acanthaster planci]|uniref:Protein PIH1D3-like n=1 Tax=Acanthaster planci TaxID=133434 RepID=A0A8B7XG06_ACAPL|nr:protein PIH1D3-like [Acanthaster planci]XP_022079705.1 protein PIH1D3-like [Acanthaster planci]XP_022079706.1 protein PIH1D3-like [Acanthaster planci]XP_022079707.1 protein PIH1D3-like [Acanthaster planci]XP_022079708.1 protein PIH1D3-like [Acanthaster planci]XP_022079709.1 protein PIH1D3-like [Acanthaster planci]XP_022079710.1 protein PIH1D3-like [Acanthaster planci]XP_022079711.1 protein PIH1D3-like [Acanthaster planci]XP_022079712.1 protein PIH1D3-like [Acanthaster planci]XP_02207971
MDLPVGGINALAELLKPSDQGESDDDDKPVTASAKLGPGAIGQTAKTQAAPKQPPKKETKDIWDAEEVSEGAEYEDIDDPRLQPEYDIIFKQAVTTEDMFLQMSNKTPSSVSCEDMVIKIILPNTKMADVDLDLKDKFLSCRTPKYKLGLHLPHPVDSKNGKAQWISDKETLVVTCRMVREYDFLTT